MKKFFISLSISLSILVIFLIYIISSIDYKGFKDVSLHNSKSSSFVDELLLDSNKLNKFVNEFPNQVKKEQISFNEFRVVDNELIRFDSVVNNSFASQGIMSIIYTKILFDNNKTNCLDTLNSILIWVDEFKLNQITKSKYSSCYSSIVDFWYNSTLNTIDSLAKNDNNIKFSFKYRYLLQKCNENGYYSNAGHSIIEKLVINIMENNWSYIFNRFWNGTSILYKFLVFTMMLFGTFLCVFGIIYIKNRML